MTTNTSYIKELPQLSLILTVVLFVLFHSLLLFIMYLNELSLLILWDLPTILYLSLSLTCFAIASFSWDDLKQTLKTTKDPLNGESPTLLFRAYLVWDTLAKGTIVLGIIGFVAGLIVIMANISDPSTIFPGFAVATLTLTIGVSYFWCFFKILKSRVNTAVFESLTIPLKPEKNEPIELKPVGGLGWALGNGVFFIVVLAPFLLMGGNLLMYWDFPSLLGILMGTVGVGLLGHSGQGIPLSFKFMVLNHLGKARQELSYNKYSALAAIAIYMGLFGVIVGMIIIITMINDPSRIGPGLAVAFVSMLYGCIAWIYYKSLASRILSCFPEMAPILKARNFWKDKAENWMVLGVILILFTSSVALVAIAPVYLN